MSVSLVASHPVVACARDLKRALEEVAEVEPMFMAPEDKRAALMTLHQAEAMLVELRLRVLDTATDVAESTGARDAAAWFSHATQTDTHAARADAHLAAALKTRPLVAAGMRDGTVSLAQARVIVAGLAALPDHIEVATIGAAEATLVGHCAEHRPKELRVLARRILEIVSPETVDEEDAEVLEEQERRARESASVTFHDLGDGRTKVIMVLPTATAERLRGYLDAHGSPRRSAGGPGDSGRHGAGRSGAEEPATTVNSKGQRTPMRRRLAHAFAELLEILDPDQLPEHGGLATTVMVTMTLDQLRAELATAGLLGHGETDISAEEARRLACTAGIIPAVLGGAGQVLDLGRTQRLFNKAQRRALRLRDRHCRAEGCTIPAAWTEAHHLIPWSHGGASDLANAISLCSHHHHRIHDRGYTHERLADGDIRFYRRA